MLDNFEIAAGSVLGRDHNWTGKNNQDAFCYAMSENTAVLIACDGCGSGAHTEVGAQLGARILTGLFKKHAARWAAEPQDDFPYFTDVRDEALALFKPLVAQMGTRAPAVVTDYFLFTAVGAVITPARTVVFAFGDGLVALNGETLRIGPFPGNEPPYLGYGLVETSALTTQPDALQFQVLKNLPTAEVESVLVGTDGLAGWERIADKTIPGKDEPIGPLAQFWEQDRYFKNPDMLRRRLALINRETCKPVWERRSLEKYGGLLPDDATMVVCRRKQGLGVRG